MFMKKNKSKFKSVFTIIVKKIKNLSKYDKMTYLWTGFFVMIILLLINVVIMSLYLISDRDEFKIFNNAYINAVLPNQDINEKLDLGIIKIGEFDINNIDINDQVIIKGDFSLDVYWVEDIVSIDKVNSTIDITYDQISSNSFTKDDIIGVYIEDAKFMGSIYYSSSFLRGYSFLTMSHLFVVFGFYYIFLTQKEEQRGSKNENIV